MNPLVLIVPVAVLVLGPRLWVQQVLKQHNRKENERFPSGGVLAKELLDRHNLQKVKVESSDIGDHYDPKAKAVRLTRDKIERKTLTAITTAAHEVAHALQDASNYPPFVWRMRLVTLAQTTGQFASVILIAVPAVALFTRHMVPPVLIGAAAFAMLGTGMAAQLAALPTELDASFGRAMPLLRESYITEKQAKDARKILIASSLTYVASSLLSVLHIWPWLGWWGPMRSTGQTPRNPTLTYMAQIPQDYECANTQYQRCRQSRKRRNVRFSEGLARQFVKPLIRSWLQLCRTR